MKKADNNRNPRQIPTKRRIIMEQLRFSGQTAVFALLNCLSAEAGQAEQKNYMVLAAMCFERMSCLVYRGKAGVWQKPPVGRYYAMFERWTQTPQEVFDAVKGHGVSADDAERVHKLIWQTADLVCPMMACETAQAFPGEYAYAIEYVIHCGGDLPKPEMHGLFPANYADYDYTKGVAGVMNGYAF